MAKTLATRMAFGQEIIEIAKTNENFVVCNADTKTCGLEKFGKYFPEREFSFGIAEQNLVAIVDCNGVQINGWVNDIMTVEPLADKWRAFGWKVVEVNGHNMKDVLTALHTAKTMRHPTAILMRTVKGKGVSFMEDDSVWHGSAPDDEQMVKAIAEIKEGGVV